MRIDQLNIRRLIVGSFAIALVVVIATSLLVRGALDRLESVRADQQALDALKGDLLVIQEEMTGQRAIQAELAVIGDVALVEEFENSATRAFAQWDVALQRPMAGQLELAAAVERIMEIDVTHDATFGDVLVPAVEAGDRESMTDAAPVLQEISELFEFEIDALLTEVDGWVGTFEEDAQSARDQVTIALWVSSLSSIATIVGLGATTMTVLRRRFTGEIAALDQASIDLRHAGEDLVASSEDARSELSTISESSQAAAANISQLSRSIDDMTGAIREIAANSAEVSSVAGDAVDWTRVTNRTVGKLGESSAEIGDVLEVIASIAEQTNLLALNATIEAARAGDAGKGFAVVANEVKELAKQTSAATERISARVGAIQTVTAESVEAIDRISAVIDRISELQKSVSAAVEEQHITTEQIGEIISLVVSEVEGLSTRVTEAATVAERAAATAGGARDRTAALSTVADNMRSFAGLASAGSTGVVD
ncbi:MAG: methyl-accepting chemotaxis protein [Acidimicrobiales bacterium]